MSLKRGIKWILAIILTKNVISNGDKLSIQLQKLGKNTQRMLKC